MVSICSHVYVMYTGAKTDIRTVYGNNNSSEVKVGMHQGSVEDAHTHNTHTQPRYSSLDFVQDNLDELVPEGTYRHLLYFLVQNDITQADAPTIQMNCHPIQINWCPHLHNTHHFYAGCPSWHNPPNLSWLGTGTKYAGLHTWWLGCTSVDIGVNANLELVNKFCYLGDMFSVDGDADAAVETRIRIGWNKFRQLVTLLTNKDISLIVRGRLYSCV